MNRHPWKTIFRLALLVAIFFLMPFSHIVHAHATRADPRVRERNPAAAGMPQSTVPTIDLWYGTTQFFGGLGLPQDRINILGNLSPSDGYTLEYQINGGAFQPVTLGTDPPSNARLVNVGDFNIELFDPNYHQAEADINVPPELRLVNGVNTLVLRVLDSAEEEIPAAGQEVTIHYTPLGELTWPLPYQIDWSAAGDISQVAQVIDGKWEITGGELRIREPGYDRLIGLGGVDWDDYEVRTSFIVHTNPGSEGGIGVIIGWQGHYQRGSETPTTGWARLGAYGYYSYRPGKHLVIRLDDADPPAGQPFDFEFGTRYHLVMQVESEPGDPNESHYRLKMWKEGDSEPAEWGVERTDSDDRRPMGSVLLVAHLVDTTFGDVSITPVQPTYNLIYDANLTGGTITGTPPNTYNSGQAVTLTAAPANGFVFQKWLVNGQEPTDNPLNFALDAHTEVAAVFAPTAPGEYTDSVYLPMVIR